MSKHVQDLPEIDPVITSVEKIKLPSSQMLKSAPPLRPGAGFPRTTASLGPAFALSVYKRIFDQDLVASIQRINDRLADL